MSGSRLGTITLLMVAFAVGVGLSELDVWLNRPVPGTNLPRGLGTFVSHNAFIVSLLIMEEVFGHSPSSLVAARLVRAGLFGALLALLAWAIDLAFGRRGSVGRRYALILTIFIAFALVTVMLFPITELTGPVIGRHHEPYWIILADHRFGALGSLGRRKPITVRTTFRSSPREFLTWEEQQRLTNVVFLNAAFERVFIPSLSDVPADIPSLDRNPLVLATTDPQMARELQADSSLRVLTERARRREIRLVILDPEREPAGLGALLLLAQVNGIGARSARDLLAHIEPMPRRHDWWNPRDGEVNGLPLSTINGAGVVFLIDNFQCVELSKSVSELQAVHPREATILLDYPVIVTPWSQGEYREMAERYVRFLASSSAQRIKALHPEPRCLESSAPAPIEPTFEDVRAWVGTWDALKVRTVNTE